MSKEETFLVVKMRFERHPFLYLILWRWDLSAIPSSISFCQDEIWAPSLPPSHFVKMRFERHPFLSVIFLIFSDWPNVRAVFMIVSLQAPAVWKWGWSVWCWAGRLDPQDLLTVHLLSASTADVFQVKHSFSSIILVIVAVVVNVNYVSAALSVREGANA